MPLIFSHKSEKSLYGTGEHTCIDYCGTVPGAVRHELYAGKPDIQNEGPLSPTVPGSAAGWLAALERFGTLSAAEVFAPAIELAEGGFAITKKGHEFFEASFNVLDANSQPFRDPEFSAASATYMRPDGSAPELGDIVKQAELGKTLRGLAEHGADYFYRGALAEQIVAHLQKHGGVITLEDLAAYEPRWMAPITSSYRGFQVSGCPPPNFAVQIQECLNILEGFPLGQPGWEHNSTQTLHAFIEAMKIAASDRAANVRTAEDTPADTLTSKGFAAARRKLINAEQATPCPTDGARHTRSDTPRNGAARIAPADAMGWFKAQGLCLSLSLCLSVSLSLCLSVCLSLSLSYCVCAKAQLPTLT